MCWFRCLLAANPHYYTVQSANPLPYVLLSFPRPPAFWFFPDLISFSPDLALFNSALVCLSTCLRPPFFLLSSCESINQTRLWQQKSTNVVFGSELDSWRSNRGLQKPNFWLDGCEYFLMNKIFSECNLFSAFKVSCNRLRHSVFCVVIIIYEFYFNIFLLCLQQFMQRITLYTILSICKDIKCYYLNSLVGWTTELGIHNYS